MEPIKLSKLRGQISKLVKQVEHKRPILLEKLEKRGRPVATFLPIEKYKRLKKNQKIVFGEYDLGNVKGTMRREEIYNGHPKTNSI